MKLKPRSISRYSFQKNYEVKFRKPQRRLATALVAFTLMMFSQLSAFSQEKPRMIRIARIVVDSAQLENYKAALREGIETAVRVEPGVLSLSAVYEKQHPTHVTVFEIYADEDAYKTHILTAHFKKYKNTVKDMVKSLELVDVSPIAMEAKPKM
ncbi:MAG TPA: antibiotic biosynthesis monooxygenase [Puia sp.]|nr:antibiotic biosynthesis monooxygenase [Puia sp.]